MNKYLKKKKEKRKKEKKKKNKLIFFFLNIILQGLERNKNKAWHRP